MTDFTLYMWRMLALACVQIQCHRRQTDKLQLLHGDNFYPHHHPTYPTHPRTKIITLFGNNTMNAFLQ